jgi:hypothetical protein
MGSDHGISRGSSRPRTDAGIGPEAPPHVIRETNAEMRALDEKGQLAAIEGPPIAQGRDAPPSREAGARSEHGEAAPSLGVGTNANAMKDHTVQANSEAVEEGHVVTKDHSPRGSSYAAAAARAPDSPALRAKAPSGTSIIPRSSQAGGSMPSQDLRWIKHPSGIFYCRANSKGSYSFPFIPSCGVSTHNSSGEELYKIKGTDDWLKRGDFEGRCQVKSRQGPRVEQRNGSGNCELT